MTSNSDASQYLETRNSTMLQRSIATHACPAVRATRSSSVPRSMKRSFHGTWRCRGVMANKFLPHLFVLPEDDANRQVATGFELALSSTRQVRVLTEAGGWARVGECFVSDHISPMRKFKTRFMILLVDFDEKMSRLDHVKGKIPDDLQDRVFVLGAFSTPEALRKAGLC